MRHALSFALPLRAAAVRTALLNIEASIKGETYGNDYQSRGVYDANALDRIGAMWSIMRNTATQITPRLTVERSEVPVVGGVRNGFYLPLDVLRLCFILNIFSICPEFSACQQAAFLLLSEPLKMSIRCFLPGGSRTVASLPRVRKPRTPFVCHAHSRDKTFVATLEWKWCGT